MSHWKGRAGVWLLGINVGVPDDRRYRIRRHQCSDDACRRVDLCSGKRLKVRLANVNHIATRHVLRDRVDSAAIDQLN